jgi:hypothetical protein
MQLDLMPYPAYFDVVTAVTAAVILLRRRATEVPTGYMGERSAGQISSRPSNRRRRA